ncbi:putative PAS sensor signal transduction histidine kinase [Methanocella conradii HZ254]|uniref:histidine kinase n=2 Tax=Methanocella TaxID=570266 RepID=H8I6B9_METCZ|nr:putative PAS sensor signal transduction histidine kinase [Methanocella conradii HZ254]
MEKGLSMKVGGAFRDAMEIFKALFDSSSAGILVYQGEDTVYVNPAMAELEGYPLEERRWMKFWETVHPDFREAVRRRAEARQRGEAVPATNELKIIRKNGEQRWVTSSAGTFILDGRPAVILILQDITGLKHAEEALKKSQYILAKAQQIAHVGNWAWNLKTGALNWSEEVYRIFGYGPGEVKPTYEWVLSRVHPEDRAIMMCFAEDVAMLRRCSVDYRVLRPDGSIRYVNSVADKIIVGKSGEPERAYGINQDITERKKAEEALMAAKAEAELYVDLMGHDINNMNQITMGYLELAHNILDFEGKLGHDSIYLIERAIDSLNNSSKLIDNVRKLQRERMGMYGQEVLEVTGIIQEVVEQFKSVPNRKVTIDYRPAAKCHVKANSLLKDVFLNLVGNSIKHSTGPLNIAINVEVASYDGEDYCRVAVEDDGPGIPDALKQTLFNRLSLASTRVRGKGFGLCLIKSLIDDYRGKFWVEDRVPGDHTKGSRFVVLLPTYNVK